MKLLWAILSLPLVAETGSGAPPIGDVTVRISRGFATPPVLERSMPWRPSSAMGLLGRVSTVETAFGGAFVERIDGIPGKAEERGGRAWFYYANGMMAQTGAGAYAARRGDEIWWDYHAWEGVNQVRALIGSYPRPFVGFAAGPARPVLVVHTPGAEEKAAALKASLEGLGLPDVRALPIHAGDAPDDSPVLAIGPWEEIAGFPAVRAAVSHGGRCGLFIDSDRSAMRVLDLAGRPRASYPNAGAIAAVAGGRFRPTPLWLVTGTDLDAARRAADILISRPERIRGMAAAVIDGGSVRPAPAVE